MYVVADHQESFHYLNQGGSPNIDGVDDLKTFNETRSALTTLGKKYQLNYKHKLTLVLKKGLRKLLLLHLSLYIGTFMPVASRRADFGVATISSHRRHGLPDGE